MAGVAGGFSHEKCLGPKRTVACSIGQRGDRSRRRRTRAAAPRRGRRVAGRSARMPARRSPKRDPFQTSRSRPEEKRASAVRRVHEPRRAPRATVDRRRRHRATAVDRTCAPSRRPEANVLHAHRDATSPRRTMGRARPPKPRHQFRVPSRLGCAAFRVRLDESPSSAEGRRRAPPRHARPSRRGWPARSATRAPVGSSAPRHRARTPASSSCRRV